MKLVVNPVKIEIYDEEMHGHIVATGLGGAAMTETLTWTPAATKPDADISVLCWRDTREWFSGWWDDEAGAWFDAATGGIVEGVTHWAEVRGPQ